jgi:hypothetical protein
MSRGVVRSIDVIVVFSLFVKMVNWHLRSEHNGGYNQYQPAKSSRQSASSSASITWQLPSSGSPRLEKSAIAHHSCPSQIVAQKVPTEHDSVSYEK